MTDSFFIRTITALLENPNLDQFVRTVRKEFQQQLDRIEHEVSCQIKEGRKNKQNDIINNAKFLSLRSFCEHAFSHHTVQRVLNFWFTTQGRHQISEHDAGRYFRMYDLTLSTALKLLTSHVLYVDSTFKFPAKASKSITKPPYVESLSSSCGDFDGGQQITIRGRRLGLSSEDLMDVKFGDHLASTIRWISEEEIICTTPKINVRKLALKNSSG
jgi:hypothetical protein